MRWWNRLPFAARLILPWLVVAAFVAISVIVLLGLIALKAVTGSG
jgi:hypothetical protein